MHIPGRSDGNPGRLDSKIGGKDYSPPSLLYRLLHLIVATFILDPLIVVDYSEKFVPFLLSGYPSIEGLILNMES